MSVSPKSGALILAAGKGTRMCSRRPKVLHTLLGDSMLCHVTRALSPLFKESIWTVIGHEAEMVRTACSDMPMHCVEQAEQLGTGHALMTALPDLQAAGIEQLLLINGDTPLVTTATLKAFVRDAEGTDLAFATLTLKHPGSFGRVIRHNRKVVAIIEAKDYDPALHGPEPREINAGLYMFNLRTIAPLLPRLSNANKSGEYYITDLIRLAVEAKLMVSGLDCGDNPALLGINSPAELARSEELLRGLIVEERLNAGVTIHAPATVRIAPGAVTEPGAELFGPCELYGRTHIEADAVVESHCVIKDSRVGAGSVIRHYSHLEDAVVGPECTVGPFARLRPGAEMETGAHVGNFVEMKKARLGKGSKANHLTYLGDADIGPGANIGAGTITCNYDGVNKHRTRIGAGAFIGSNSSLIAPVEIGANAVVGAGSAISKPVPENTLGVTRAPQRTLPRKDNK